METATFFRVLWFPTPFFYTNFIYFCPIYINGEKLSKTNKYLWEIRDISSENRYYTLCEVGGYDTIWFDNIEEIDENGSNVLFFANGNTIPIAKISKENIDPDSMENLFKETKYESVETNPVFMVSCGSCYNFISICNVCLQPFTQNDVILCKTSTTDESKTHIHYWENGVVL